jgi:transaldolase/glucose-6-phosphate isomerase
MNPLRQLAKLGQAVWLDYIRRKLLVEGGLRRLIEEDGLTGVTSNPSIFEKAIGGSDDYDAAMAELLDKDRRMTAGELFESLAIEDIRMAADQLRGVYDASGGADGFVSLEVSPYLAHDTAATVEEARRLWRAVDRPNLMIKVPGTAAGVPAFETLIAEGVNVNVTLMFSLATYEAVAQAYLRGLGRCRTPESIASVASFFVSRVDTEADARLEKIGTPEALALRGKTAIANAKLAYDRFRQIFYGEPFAALADRGARVQRVLWASTSTKNPDYRDVVYVEELIGRDTVNTLPPATLDAFRDHGEARPSLEEDVEGAQETLRRLAAVGLDLDDVTAKLQRDGVAAFAASFDQLLAAVERERRRMIAEGAPVARFALGDHQGLVGRRLQLWQDEQFGRRLWMRDHTLFAPEWVDEVVDRMGWLTLPESMAPELPDLTRFAEEVRGEGFRHAVVLGMGGSSLAPEVFARVFGTAPGYPKLCVLDSTHPDAVRALGDQIRLDKALFVVSSKSGTTVETLSFFHAFWDRLQDKVDDPGRHFVAITDPGSPLASLGRERGFRRIFIATPDVGGRYSAFTPFGLVPAALAGVDVGELLDRARTMAEACSADRPEPVSSALALGAALGELARRDNGRRDKLTLLTSPALDAFPDWLEQLVAESLGKAGRGVVPVVDEPLAAPEAYGDDRLFVALLLAGNGDGTGRVEAGLDALERAGHPVVRLELGDRYDLGGEIFRWELAVAAAGAVLGVHPFDQPDVQLAKELAHAAMSAGGGGERAPEPVPADDAEALRREVDGWLDAAAPGGYLALQAYLAPTPEAADALATLQRELRDRTRLATTVGWGPRFLHSTGQLHKGGPEGGLFLQLLDRPAADLPVPGSELTFGRLIRGQADGDAAALIHRGRRVLRVDLGSDPVAALGRLVELFTAVPV